MPIELKQQVRRKYEAHIEYLNSIGVDDTEKWQGIITFVERKKPKISNIVTFTEFNTRLDRIRKESFVDVFPELKDLLQHA